MIDPKLMSVLVCPATKLHLKKITKKKLDEINQKIRSKNLYFKNGELITNEFQDALITTNGKTVYYIEHNVPYLIEEKSLLIR